MKKIIKKVNAKIVRWREDPKGSFSNLISSIKNYLRNNRLFVVFVLVTVLNSTILRFVTMTTTENYLSFKPIVADLAFAIIIGSFSYLFKTKGKQFAYLMFFTVVLTALCTINSIYYTFYTSFASVSMLPLMQFAIGVGDAIVENVIQIKDVLYLSAPIIMIITYISLKKDKKVKNIKSKKVMLKTALAGFVLFVLFALSLTSLEIGRFASQWNREYIVMRFGIYTYQVNDIVQSVGPQITSLFGYDSAMKEFEEYQDNKEEPEENEYTDVLKGKNIIAIHAESIQQFVIGLEFNGQEVTPNLNRLVEEGLSFTNFYSQVSVGTSSDTELTLSTSLMPTLNGTAFVSYFDREYVTMYDKLKEEQGYYIFSMHGNTADFWNRRVMHENLGYDKFYSKADYDVTEENIIGLGINDVEFFSQSIQYIEEIASQNQPYYGTMITLTNHTPFSDVDKYGEFPVDIKEEVTNPDGTTSIVSYPYLEGTKLGNYLKSVHYADMALGLFFEELDAKGLLENTAIVIYGDHDARLSSNDYELMYNYDKLTNSTIPEDDPNYFEMDDYQYELNRKLPLIIWTKDQVVTGTNDNIMGMYDVGPTLGNMMGFENEYALGHDIFDIKEDNIVVFPNGNWVTNKVYYNSQKREFLPLTEEVIGEEYISEGNAYSEELLAISNNIIVYNLLKGIDDDELQEEGVITK